MLDIEVESSVTIELTEKDFFGTVELFVLMERSRQQQQEQRRSVADDGTEAHIKKLSQIITGYELNYHHTSCRGFQYHNLVSEC